jgi:hypothetical protein
MSATNNIANLTPELVTQQWAFRNRIINGSCNIAQRPAFAATTATSGYGGPDRFIAVNGETAGGEFTQSQGTIMYNGIVHNAVVQTVNAPIVSTTTTNYWSGIEQRVEGLNCYDLLGQPVTVSFIFETNVSGTYSVALIDGTGTNSFVTTFLAVASTPVKVLIPISMLPLTLGTPNSPATGLQCTIGFLNTGTYQTSTLGMWQTGAYITAMGATNWGAVTGNYIALTNLQLEAGTSATTFETRHSGIEFALCQRYCYRISNVLTPTLSASVASGFVVTTTQMYVPVMFPVLMRTIPTLTYFNIWGATYTELAPATSTSTVWMSLQGVTVVLNASGATWTGGQGGEIYVGSSTLGWINFDAEL